MGERAPPDVGSKRRRIFVFAILHIRLGIRRDKTPKSTYQPFRSSFIKYVPAGKFNYWLGFPADTHTYSNIHSHIHSF